jgi:hypothetical protein
MGAGKVLTMRVPVLVGRRFESPLGSELRSARASAKESRGLCPANRRADRVSFLNCDPTRLAG